MSKKYYRFFGGLLTAQEHWLNKMSEKGYRLIRAEKMLYEFEACKPDQVKYCVEFIGQKSKANASDYHEFLEGMGYKVFYKNINLNYSEDDNPVALKADFILSLCELIMGSKDGLQPIEKTVIDRCVHQIYQRYFDNPAPENMPILEDLYDALLKQDEKEAHHVATALEIYVKGSLKLFNNRTNVDIQNRLVCFDIKELGNQLKKIGMLIVQD